MNKTFGTKVLAAGLAGLLASAGVAYAGGYFTPGLPYATATTGNEMIPADTQLPAGAYPQTEAISVATLGGYGSAKQFNYLIGGDFGTNLWQRGTTHTAIGNINGTALYGPDRWFAWGTSSSTIQIDKTAITTVPGFTSSAKIARTGADVNQVCFAQEVASATSASLQGTNVELDYHALAGAGFSASGSNLAVYVVYGTGTDDGSSKMAWNINTQGGGSSGWTGYAAALNGVLQPISTTWTRYTAFAAIPATANEVGVAFCWTPVGGSPSNDNIQLAGVQLTRYVGTPQIWSPVQTAGNYNGQSATSPTNLLGTSNVSSTVPATPFWRRPAAQETELQLSYYYQLNDPAATVRIGSCQVVTANTVVRCLVPLPVPMRAAPTITAPGSNTAFAITAADGTANVCTALAATASATVLAYGSGVSVDCTPTSNIAITVPSMLIGDAQAFHISASAEL
jgi:hypothetical protein